MYDLIIKNGKIIDGTGEQRGLPSSFERLLPKSFGKIREGAWRCCITRNDPKDDINACGGLRAAH